MYGISMGYGTYRNIFMEHFHGGYGFRSRRVSWWFTMVETIWLFGFICFRACLPQEPELDNLTTCEIRKIPGFWSILKYAVNHGLYVDILRALCSCRWISSSDLSVNRSDPHKRTPPRRPHDFHAVVSGVSHQSYHGMAFSGKSEIEMEFFFHESIERNALEKRVLCLNT